jgi:hypothetical protein
LPISTDGPDADRPFRLGAACTVRTPEEREALLAALRQQAAAYERFVAEHGSFGEAVDQWLRENGELTD